MLSGENDLVFFSGGVNFNSGHQRDLESWSCCATSLHYPSHPPPSVLQPPPLLLSITWNLGKVLILRPADWLAAMLSRLLTFCQALIICCWLSPLPAGCWSQETAVGAACQRGCNLFQWSFLKACVWLIVFMCECMAPYALVGCVLGCLCPQLASMLFMLCSRWLEYWLPRGLPAAPTLFFLSPAQMKCEFCFWNENAE